MRTHTLILLTLIFSGCGGDSSDEIETTPGLPISEGGSCEINSGELTCNGALSNLSNLDQLEGLTSINFDGAALSQQELDSIPVLDQVTSFTINSRGSSIETFNAEQFPALNTLNLSNNSVLKRIDNLDLLPQLKVLNLQDNQFLETMDVSALDQLTHFYALNNNALSVDLATLPAQNSLTTLEIAGSKIYIRPSTSVRSASTDNVPTELISQFTHLTHLTIDGDNRLSASAINSIIDNLGHQLIKLSITDLSEHTLLDASNLSSLQHLDVRNSNIDLELTQLPDSIIYLDISDERRDISSLIEPSILPNITSLGIGENQLGNEQVKAVIDKYGAQLVELDVSYNNLTEFDPTSLTQLKALDISRNEDLNFDLSVLPTDIERLGLYETAIKDSSPLVNMTSLSEFTISRASLWQHIDAVINANRNTLTELYIENTDLRNLSLTDMPQLSKLSINSNYALSDLTIATLPSLTHLDIYENTAVSTLNLTDFPALDRLLIANQDAMYELVIDNTPLLTEFIFVYNQFIENVSLTNLKFLSTVFMTYNNSLKSLHFDNLPALYHLDVYNLSALTSLTINNLPALYELNVSRNNALASLDISDLPALYHLDVYLLNALTSLTINNLPALYELYVGYNDILTSLEINSLDALTNVSAMYNETLTSLSILGTPSLGRLYVPSNKDLETLTLDSSTKAEVYISGTKLIKETLETTYREATFYY